MAGENAKKTLLKALSSAFANEAPNPVPLPLPSGLVNEIETFIKEANSDECISMLINTRFNEELYNILKKAVAKNEKNEVVFFHILAMLCPFILEFKSLLYWVNQCLTNALNSAGIPNDVVVVSRFFLKSLLVCGSSTAVATRRGGPSAQALDKIRLRNAAYLFKLLVKLYFMDDLNVFQHGSIVRIKIQDDLSITTENLTDAKLVSDLKSLESFEAKRFVNLNTRQLLLEFMIREPALAFEVLNDFAQSPLNRGATFGLVAELLCHQSNLLSFQILRAAPSGREPRDDNIFQPLLDAMAMLQQKYIDNLGDAELKEKIANIYNNIYFYTDFRVSVAQMQNSRFLKTLFKSLLFDSDTQVLNSGILLFVMALPTLHTKFKQLLPVCLLVYGRLISWNKSLKMFPQFGVAQCRDMLRTVNSVFTEKPDIDDLQNAIFPYLNQQEMPSNSYDVDIGKFAQIDDLLENKTSDSDVSWVRVESRKDDVFKYKFCSKLYTVLYGLFPNCLLEFMKSPTAFMESQFGIVMTQLLTEDCSSFFNELDIYNNSLKIAAKHLFSPGLLASSVQKETSLDLDWINDQKPFSELLWDCLKLDKDVSLKFHYPPDPVVNENILKLFFHDTSLTAEKVATINEIFKLVTHFKLESYGFESPALPDASLLSSPSFRPTVSSLKRKPSVLSAHSEPQDVSSILNKQEHVFAQLSPQTGPQAGPELKQTLPSTANLSSLSQPSLSQPSAGAGASAGVSVGASANTPVSPVPQVPQVPQVPSAPLATLSATATPSAPSVPSVPSASSAASPAALMPTSTLAPASVSPVVAAILSPAVAALNALTDSPNFVPLDEPEHRAEMAECQQLQESLKYYKRELLVLANDNAFSELVRLLNNAELERVKSRKFDKFLELTKSNKLEELKQQDLKFQRDAITKKYVKINKELSLLLTRKRRNDESNLETIRKLREEVNAMENKMNNLLDDLAAKDKCIEDYKKYYNDKDTAIISLQNTLKHLQLEKKIEEDTKKLTSNKVASTREQFGDYFDKLTALKNENKKLYDKKEYYKDLSRKFKKELGSIEPKVKEEMDTWKQEQQSRHSKALDDVSAKLAEERKKSTVLQRKSRVLAKSILMKNKEIENLNKRLTMFTKQTSPITLRDDIPTYNEVFKFGTHV